MGRGSGSRGAGGGAAVLWSRTVGLASFCGLTLGAMTGHALAVVAGLTFAYVVALTTLVSLSTCRDTDARVDWRQARGRAALYSCACVGFVAGASVLPGTALLVASVAGLTHPAAVSWCHRHVGRTARWPIAGPLRAADAAGPTGPTGSDQQVTRLLDAGPTPEGVAALDDAALCVAWRRSYLMLRTADTPAHQVVVAQLRQYYLDELERRHPHSFGCWLATEPTASSSPASFLPHARDDDAA